MRSLARFWLLVLLVLVATLHDEPRHIVGSTYDIAPDSATFNADGRPTWTRRSGDFPERSVVSRAQLPAPKGVFPTPQVTNTKLQNIVKDLYKGTTTPGRVGTGTTADAVRHELATGLRTGGKFHSQKAEQYSNALRSVLKQDLDFHDRLVAQSLLDDLQRAMRRQP